MERIENLEGRWKFSIGEQSEWLDPSFNDDNWESIYVPETWEEQGFHGYNGFATYRKDFTLDRSQEGLMLYLGLGYIDDVTVWIWTLNAVRKDLDAFRAWEDSTGQETKP